MKSKFWLAVIALSSIGILGAGKLYAANTYMCPSSYRYFNVGDDEASVRAACGKPLSSTTKTEYTQKFQTAEQWFYTLGDRNIKGGTRKSPVTLTIVNNKVASIEIAGQSTLGLSVCPGPGISVGSSKFNVSASCGRPNFINTTKIPVQSQANKVTTWTYQFGNYQGGVVVKFKEGTVQSISQTQ